MASLRSPFHIARSLSADPHTPRYGRVCFPGRSIVHRPNMSGYSWNCQVPRAPLHEQGVTSLVVVSETTSTGVTLLSSLVRTHAPVLVPPSASEVPSDSGSVQVAVSPCWEEDLPDVISAHLSLRAWTPTPAAREVRLPVSSPKPSAFPPFGPGRRSTKPVQRLQHGALFEAAVIPCRLLPEQLRRFLKKNILHPHIADGRIRISHFGSSGWRARRASTAFMARLLSATPL